MMERENVFFKSSPEDEYHLPQINFEKVYFGCRNKGAQSKNSNELHSRMFELLKLNGETF
jgi:hypothetical protein